jgi:hypothetical protein
MNYAGCMRKFNVAEFVARFPKAAENCLAAGGEPAKSKKARKAATTSGGTAASKVKKAKK